MSRKTFCLLQLAACCLLGGCGNVKLQSLDSFTGEWAKVNERQDRNACARNTSDADYRECVRRVEQAYEATREERDKNKSTR